MSNERIEAFYRDATAADVARVMKGEEVEARFSDEMTAFFNSALNGWTKDCLPYVWVDGDGSHWKFCHVYAPPQWYVDKPEPGEGYRLLSKFPDEPVQVEDFVFEKHRNWVRLRTGGDSTQVAGCWYRRRIDPPKPEPKHYKLNVGDTVVVVSEKRCTVCQNWKGVPGKIIASSKNKIQWHVESSVHPMARCWFYTDELLLANDAPKPEPKHYTLQVGDTADAPGGHRIEVTEIGVWVQ